MPGRHRPENCPQRSSIRPIPAYSRTAAMPAAADLLSGNAFETAITVPSGALILNLIHKSGSMKRAVHRPPLQSSPRVLCMETSSVRDATPRPEPEEGPKSPWNVNCSTSKLPADLSYRPVQAGPPDAPTTGRGPEALRPPHPAMPFPGPPELGRGSGVAMDLKPMVCPRRGRHRSGARRPGPAMI